MHFYQKDLHCDLLLVDILLWRKKNLKYGQYLVIFLAIYPYVNVKHIQNVRIFQIFRRNDFFWFSKRIFHGKWHIMEKISSEMNAKPRYTLLYMYTVYNVYTGGGT